MFLIGGQTKDIIPKAIFIHSGDIVVMSKQSRLAYHGVPKILSPSNHASPIPSCLSKAELAQRIREMKPFCLVETEKSPFVGELSSVKLKKKDIVDFEDISKFDYHWLQTNWDYFEQYLSNTRININIRQVYH